MEPKVESFERTLAFVGSRTQPVLVVHDYLRTDAPAKFSWLLHAVNPMKTRDRDGIIYIEDGNARAAVRMIAGVPYSVDQRSGFPSNPRSLQIQLMSSEKRVLRTSRI